MPVIGERCFDIFYRFVDLCKTAAIPLEHLIEIAVLIGIGAYFYLQEEITFIDNFGNACERYPENPNGSPEGITALTTPDGRVTIMMPHPERVFRALQHSWCPEQWTEDGPWMRLFRNARAWVG